MPLHDLAGLARFAHELPGELQKAQVRGVNQAALHVTKAIRLEIRSVAGAGMRLSGVGRRGARVGARYDVKGTVNPTAIVRATGPLHFVEHDMPPHRITPRGRRRRKRGNGFLSGAKALKLANGQIVAGALHPGTTGSRPFEKGYLKSRGDTGRIYDAEVQRAIRVVLR